MLIHFLNYGFLTFLTFQNWLLDNVRGWKMVDYGGFFESYLAENGNTDSILHFLPFSAKYAMG